MRTSTKLKAILEKHTVGVSWGNEFKWTIAVIKNSPPITREEFNGKSFSAVIDQAYKKFKSSNL
jgi:hypothetical protein